MEDYNLVSCDFHDRIEAMATLRQPCKIVYRNETDERVTAEGLIVDVYAANHADYLKLEDGTEIRMDRVVSIDGQSAEQLS